MSTCQVMLKQRMKRKPLPHGIYSLSKSVKGQKDTHNVAVQHNANTDTFLFSFMILGYEHTSSFFISNISTQVSKNQ